MTELNVDKLIRDLEKRRMLPAKTEPKTLKDLEEMNGEHLVEPYLVIPKEKLRAEAVKWYHRSDGNKHKFIREFFNLTKEDLGENGSTN